MVLRFSINQDTEIVQTTSLPGRLTQRLECYPHTVEVTGSNPVPPTRTSKKVPVTVNRRGHHGRPLSLPH
jgi:hypothetical protein